MGNHPIQGPRRNRYHGFHPELLRVHCAFPGVFRGTLNVRAHRINERRKLAAAQALADWVSPGELARDFIVPGVFDTAVVQRVAAVQAAALQSGVAG